MLDSSLKPNTGDFKTIALGAEAVIYENGNIIVKERLSKDYRIPELDRKLIKQRTRKEARIMERLLNAGVNVPKIIKAEENRIHMEKIVGRTLKEVLNTNYGATEDSMQLMKAVGELVARVHAVDVVHGDLTTLNFLLGSEVFLIDFGLSFVSTKVEDKAVDLYVFERALRCAHSESYLSPFYQGYSTAGSEEVLKRLESVRLRGRKREESSF